MADALLPKNLLQEIYQEIEPLKTQGKVASYIPELARVNPDQYGVFLSFTDGQDLGFGDAQTPFSIQSISKVLSLTLAIASMGEKIFDRVGVEPSGNAFNSLVQLEYEKGIPRNPLINAGAMVVCDALLDCFEDPKDQMLRFCRLLCGHDHIQYNEQVALSEKTTGFRNYALAYFLKSFNNLNHSVEEVLDLYFHYCSIEMSCEDLATAFLFFANHGEMRNHQRIISTSQVKRLNALMQTCGFYDEAGEFSYKVGLPGKSGVGGGIVAIHPLHYSVAVWSPRLNEKGNSTLGMKTLELLTTKLERSIF